MRVSSRVSLGAIAIVVAIACTEADRPTSTTPPTSHGETAEHLAAQTPNPPVAPAPPPGSTPVTGGPGGGTPGNTPVTGGPGGGTPGNTPVSGPGGGGGPTPQPTPSGGGTPTPTPGPGTTPPPGTRFTITEFRVFTGSPYVLVPIEDGTCCGPSDGPAWTDLNYYLNLARDAGDRSYYIRTSQADTERTIDPVMSFRVNKCARVTVTFPRALFAPCYPAWVSDGWTCSAIVNSDGTCALSSTNQISFVNISPPGDIIRGPFCSRLVPTNNVIEIGPRLPSGPSSNRMMYSVYVEHDFTCPLSQELVKFE